MCTWQTAMKTSSRIQRQALFNSWLTHLTSPLCFASLLERSVNRTDGLVWTRHSGINTPASSVHVSSKDPRGLIRANCFATRRLLSSDNAASMASEGIVFVWEQICRTWAEQINDSLLARTPIFSLNGSCKLATSCWLCFGQMEKNKWNPQLSQFVRHFLWLQSYPVVSAAVPILVPRLFPPENTKCVAIFLDLTAHPSF